MSLLERDLQQQRIQVQSASIRFDEDEDEATEREEEEEEEAFASQEAFSDSDVKHVMSKIASLEEDRLKLLHTIDQLQTDNQQVRPVVPAPHLQPPLCTWRLKVKWPEYFVI